MMSKRQRDLGFVDAAAIVGDADQPAPAFDALDPDIVRARIDGVLHQLFDH